RNPMAEIMVTGIDASVDELFMPSQNLCHPIEQMIVVDDHVCDHQHEHDRPHEHNHTHGIDSFSIRIDEPLDQNLFYDVLTFWIMRHSDSLLRVKGFLSFVEEPKPHLVNIVHDVCNIEPLERDAQGSYLVFIGIGLPETEIRKDLETCNIQAAGARKGMSYK
ncbi:MAG: GTP-binding protein, partial [SAR324 cluster bacterium]|nr:GTP-binding protein [SAR324 cluster bacterium]